MKELGKPRGRKPVDRREQEIAALTRKLERSEAELEKARRVIEIQGNVSALLEEMLGTDSASRSTERRSPPPFEELTPLIGTRPACRALGASPATIYRRRRPSEPKTPKPRPTPARALSAPERQQVLDVLHSERFVDVSPEETWATLLDEGSYLCSPRPMYRILAAKHGGVRDRRNQLTHPAYAKPGRAARRAPERAVVVGREQAEGPGEVDVLLSVRDPRRV